MKRKTPQDKKKLSYAKDRRNTFGECPTSSRKNIRRRRAIENRRYRRALKRDLGEGAFELAVSARAAVVRKSGWRKCSDDTLAAAIERKRAFRVRGAFRKSRRARRIV
jgi:hypothetical protein